MKIFSIITIFIFAISIKLDEAKNGEVILSRRKRFVAFPEGSTIIFALCNTAALIAPFQIFTEGVNWGISYDLPNGTILLDTKKYINRRRQRRELYNSIETVIESMGFEGKNCMYRALCEAPRILTRNSLYENLLHIFFKFPQEPISDYEPEDHRLYHWAYRQGMENKQQDCATLFPTCSISLIDLALGYYNDYREEQDYKTFTNLQLIFICVVSNILCASNKILSRKRRYLTFPEGSSLSVAICMTAQMGITPGEIFTEGVNWGISYELPNDTKSFKDFKKPLAVMRRRNRRDLYGKMETIINSMGYNGRSCILRAVCETKNKLKPKGETLLEEILNIVFRFPQQKLSASEPEEHKIYQQATRIGENGNQEDCEREFADCPFSLIDMALGYYSAEGYA
ncbi:uncharacterized protein LOC109597077 [Aethina tumida]|uniref:uncharacterized protein LOC109597077 n=1 Tax=Aethina tumida TaxID=116153 RepID=UPI002148AE5B|nr:uncharacterized protein LOC109597077 [Aethina tumida]